MKVESDIEFIGNAQALKMKSAWAFILHIFLFKIP